MGKAMNRTCTERDSDNQCDNRLTATFGKPKKHKAQGFSSVGRASVSKTEGRGFESLSPCHFGDERDLRCAEGLECVASVADPLTARCVTLAGSDISRTYRL